MGRTKGTDHSSDMGERGRTALASAQRHRPMSTYPRGQAGGKGPACSHCHQPLCQGLRDGARWEEKQESSPKALVPWCQSRTTAGGP